MCNGAWRESETTCGGQHRGPKALPPALCLSWAFILNTRPKRYRSLGPSLHLSARSHAIKNPNLLLWPAPALEILWHCKPSQPKVPAVLQLSHQHNTPPPAPQKLISQQALAFRWLSAQVLVNKQGVCWQGLNTSQRHLHFNRRLLQEFRPPRNEVTMVNCQEPAWVF